MAAGQVVNMLFSAVTLSTLILAFGLHITVSVSAEEEFECNTTSICESLCNCQHGSVDDDPNQEIVECVDLNIGNETFFPCIVNTTTHLYIYGSDLMELKSKQMVNLTSLQIFKIEDSPMLRTIATDAFSGLGSLTELGIRNTSVEHVDDKTFSELVKLEKLSFTISELTGLSFVHFQNLNLTLKELDLSYNNINTMVYGIFHQNSSNVLRKVDLSNNAFATIQDDLLDFLPLVEVVDISHNIIQSTDEDPFKSLVSLTQLNLHNNTLAEFPSGAFKTCSLQTLNLSMNHFNDIPVDAIGGLFTLQVLDMDGNLLTQLPEKAFVGVETLTELHLSNMPIFAMVLEDAFAQLGLLTYLYMSNNSVLESMDPLAFPPDTLTHLTHMYIQDNKFTLLHSHMFTNDSFLPSLEEVHAYGNPFNCSCDVSWIRESMDDVSNPWIQSWKSGDTAVRCETPDNFNQTEIYQFDLYDLTCDPPKVELKETFSEVNGEEYYMQVLVNRGIPRANWTTPKGNILIAGAKHDPGTGRDIMTVRETRLENNTILTRLTIKYPSLYSVGHYKMTAWNVAGSIVEVFQADPPPSSDKKLENIGLIVGSVLGALILIVVFVVVVRFIRNRPPSYKRMDEPVSGATRDPGSLPSSQGGGEEQGPFMVSGQSSSYGGIDSANRQPQRDGDPKV